MDKEKEKNGKEKNIKNKRKRSKRILRGNEETKEDRRGNTKEKWRKEKE